MGIRGKSKNKHEISPGTRFLYQLLISCWINNITNPDIIKKILEYAVNNYKFNYRKNLKITNHTLWVFTYHIKSHIPALTMLQDTVYGEKVTVIYGPKKSGNSIINTPTFKTILTLERAFPEEDNIIFKEIYPTDTILNEILEKINE